MSKASDAAPLQAYLQCRDRASRLELLRSLKAAGEYLPISLAEDLLCLDLAPEEKVAILESTGSRDGRALEHFLTQNLVGWPQDLAALAVRLWSQATEHLLWYRILGALKSPLLPQRVFYTIVDHAFHTGGARVMAVAAEAEGLEEMSPAFHGVILHRAVQWGINTARLTLLAQSIIRTLGSHLHPDNKALPSALAYLARFHGGEVQALLDHASTAEPWRDFVRVMVQLIENQDKQIDKLTKLVTKPPKSHAAARFAELWLPLWQRHALEPEIVAASLQAAEKEPSTAALTPLTVSSPWEMHAGIPETTLVQALTLITDDKTYSAALRGLGALLPIPASSALLKQVKTRVAGASDPAAVLATLPLRLRLELTEGSVSASGIFAEIKREENATLSGDAPAQTVSFSNFAATDRTGRVTYVSGREDAATIAARKAFFDLAYRGRQPARPTAGDGYFDLLTEAWSTPTEAALAPLAQAARRTPGVLRLCYLNTLSRFKGHDQAALKLLDFTRSKEEDDIRAVVQAFGGIGTPRATQELVAALTRPNITPALQLEACQVLAKLDVGNLQNELRSAMNDLSVAPNVDSGVWDVREAIAALITPTGGLGPNVAPQSATASASLGDQPLDQKLAGKIAHYRELSSEVRRALRTSEFFHAQVMAGGAPDSIDLSPVIDMQYKALELLFRETFEEACSRLIHRGILQRRLDVIGYARPIPRGMDEFESYIASLPIVREIPFFSKFKLRKMLRAICQFRPGKRFTLDGLKAFALFFLCFGRSDCRYGLNGLFPLGFANDSDLYEFCKALHVQQDVRNRAAHEGFHPDASSDIDGIWRATAEIVQTAFKAKAHVEELMQSEFSPKNRSTPIIEKKVS